MAITKSWGYKAPSTTYAKEIPVLSKADYAVTETATMSTTYTNISSPIDQAETVKVSTKKVNNVYSGSGVMPSYMAVTKEGVQSLIQVKDIYSVQSDGTTSSASESCCTPWRIDLPTKVNITIQIPKSQYFGASEAATVISRAIGVLQQAADDTTTLNEILRGSTTVLS